MVGLIPILNIIALLKIISVTGREYKVEKEKYKLNEKRKNEQICKTKYPLLMVHGVFFRDFKHFNYWGRIPDELEKNGATVSETPSRDALRTEFRSSCGCWKSVQAPVSLPFCYVNRVIT